MRLFITTETINIRAHVQKNMQIFGFNN